MTTPPNSELVVFILTHGRPQKVTTLTTLRRQGYTGRVLLVVDNEDDALEEYKAEFGDDVIVFDKRDIAARYDTGDNFNDRRAVFYARNACFEIASRLGIRYFFEFDDDYASFMYRFDGALQVTEKPVRNLDRLFAILLRYYCQIPAITVAFSQSGDFIGGKDADKAQALRLYRKAMNTFLCSTERAYAFVGRVNEDVNTYARLGNMGRLLLTVPNIFIHQATTQAQAGGMTELYLNEGTYIKSFYTVMYCPSFVSISQIGYINKRIHHKIRWAQGVPQILSPTWTKRKERKQHE